MLNTLSFDAKSSMINPFNNPEKYPAFKFKIADAPCDQPGLDFIDSQYEESSDSSDGESNIIDDIIDTSEISQQSAGAKSKNKSSNGKFLNLNQQKFSPQKI